MFRFYFNDCIPENGTLFALTNLLSKTLLEYSLLWKSFSENIDGVITYSSPSDYYLNTDGASLYKCIAALDNKDLRAFAYRIFTKFPVEAHYFITDEDSLLAFDYKITIAGVNFNAINLVIVAENDGALFTLGLHDDLRKDILNIASNSKIKINVNNLFGERENTNFIEGLIKSSITSTLDNFGKLTTLVGNNVYSTRFKKGFEDSSSVMQKIIIEHFHDAIKRNGTSPLFADAKLIKDVTPEKCEFRVFELRIFNPIAYRIYFYERGDNTFLALIEKKPQPKKQDNHINAAVSIISELLMTY